MIEQRIVCDLTGREVPFRETADPVMGVRSRTNTARMNSHAWAQLMGIEARPGKDERDIDLSPEARTLLASVFAAMKTHGLDAVSVALASLEEIQK